MDTPRHLGFPDTNPLPQCCSGIALTDKWGGCTSILHWGSRSSVHVLSVGWDECMMTRVHRNGITQGVTALNTPVLCLFSPHPTCLRNPLTLSVSSVLSFPESCRLWPFRLAAAA